MVKVDVEEPFYSEKHSRETHATERLSPGTSNKPVVCKILANILLKCKYIQIYKKFIDIQLGIQQPTGIRFRMGRLDIALNVPP